MNTTTSITPPEPILPRPLTLPLRLMPPMLHSTALVTLLNRVFAQPLKEGELDFLRGHVMLVQVRDAGLSFRLTLSGNRLRVANSRRPHDLSIEGTLYDFLLLATRREDADTLFFNRRLRLGGNTELGLYVKNFLDALELDQRWAPMEKLLERATTMMGRWG